jgi:ribosomal protein S11
MNIKKQQKNKESLFLCNLYIKSLLKNTLISLTKKNGEILKQWSTKSLKKSKFKKNTSYNIYLIVSEINNFLKVRKIRKINIFLKGNGIGKRNIIKNLNKVRIFYIFEQTPISFNGCQKKKMKRR